MAPIELAELLLGPGQADPETLDLAEPTFRLGFGDSGDQIVVVTPGAATAGNSMT